MLEKVLDTLERIPDDVLLSALTRDMELNDGPTCLCGWVLREQLARVANVDAEDISEGSVNCVVVSKCVEVFGGTYDEWDNIYFGVVDYRADIIERALAIRVLEAVQ